MAKTILIIFSILFPNVFHLITIWKNLLFHLLMDINLVSLIVVMRYNTGMTNGETIKDWSRMMTV